MKIIHRIMNKFDNFCLILWIKWMFYTENLRLKLEDLVYKMDKKL